MSSLLKHVTMLAGHGAARLHKEHQMWPEAPETPTLMKSEGGTPTSPTRSVRSASRKHGERHEPRSGSRKRCKDMSESFGASLHCPRWTCLEPTTHGRIVRKAGPARSDSAMFGHFVSKWVPNTGCLTSIARKRRPRRQQVEVAARQMCEAFNILHV